MDIINNYEVINFKAGEAIKYTNEKYDVDITVHYLNGQIHREGDLPAIYSFTGEVVPETGLHFIKFYKHGKVHRDDNKPAIILFDAGRFTEKHWFVNGREHNDYGEPSCIVVNWEFYDDFYTGNYNWRTGEYDNDEDGEINPDPDNDCKYAEWKVNDKLHRENDLPALIQLVRGDCYGYVYKWCINGKYHRENDKPALISNNEMIWYKNGVKHREGYKPYMMTISEDYIVYDRDSNGYDNVGRLELTYGQFEVRFLYCNAHSVYRWMLSIYFDEQTLNHIGDAYREHSMEKSYTPLLYLNSNFRALPTKLPVIDNCYKYQC